LKGLVSEVSFKEYPTATPARLKHGHSSLVRELFSKKKVWSVKDDYFWMYLLCWSDSKFGRSN
jgi:hypothetical protein